MPSQYVDIVLVNPETNTHAYSVCVNNVVYTWYPYHSTYFSDDHGLNNQKLTWRLISEHGWTASEDKEQYYIIEFHADVYAKFIKSKEGHETTYNVDDAAKFSFHEAQIYSGNLKAFYKNLVFPKDDINVHLHHTYYIVPVFSVKMHAVKERVMYQSVLFGECIQTVDILFQSESQSGIKKEGDE